MKLIRTLCLFCLISLGATAENKSEGVIGLAILQDTENTTVYNPAPFAQVGIPSVSLSRVTTQEAITSLVNTQDCGKEIVNYMLSYSNGRMDDSLLMERMRQSGITNPTTADIFAAIHNNYLLVVKLTSETLSAIRGGAQPADIKMRGNWYLYALEFTQDDAQEIADYLPSPGDDAATFGRKRYLYEGVSIPLRLIATGTKIDADLPQRLTKQVKYQTAADLLPAPEPETVSPSKAAKIALAPIIIVK